MSLKALRFLTAIYISGVLSQFSPLTGEICSGDNVTFTCVVNTALGIWVVRLRGEETECLFRRSNPGQDNCGPGERFMSNATDVNEDINSSSLRVDSITIDLNDTQVKCNDGNEVTIGSDEICIIGNASAPQILSATISELGVCDDDGCVVTVRWREPFISCDGSVSQYVLTVTPPTCDCESLLQNCMLMDNAAVYLLPGNETQYDIAVNGNISLEYDMTVRADTCDNTRSGDISPVYNINISAQQRGQDVCTYMLVYRDGVEIEEIITTWPRIDVLDKEANYIVVIDSGSGESITMSDVTSFECQMDMDMDMDSCTHIYNDTSASITDSVSVSVVIIGCITNTMICINEPSSFTRCRVRDLLCTDNSCDPEYQISDDGTFIACSEDGNLCVMSNSERAQYNFSMSYCLLNGSLERTCEEDILEWTGSIPFLLHVCDENLPVWNIVVMAISAILFLIGVGIAGILGILLLLRVKSCVVAIKKLALSKKALLAASVIITIISFGVWLGLIGFIASNDFCEESNGYIRGSNSQCEPPSGDNAVKNVLVIIICVFSLLVPAVWGVSAGLLKCGVDTDENTNKAPQKPRRSKKSKEADQELAAYDNLNHGNPPSSPQPLLSESDPAYGKLNPDEEQQYSHIQREPKKPVYDPDDPNYSHFPKKEDEHYGKLDHGVKKQSTLPTSVVPPPSDSEYGKLDRSEMDSTPHYGKLDHGVRKGTTLPGTVIPPTGDEYGKLDRTQMEIVSGEPGGMYDVVTNEPRHKPPKALPKAPLGEGLYDPTAKPRKKPGH